MRDIRYLKNGILEDDEQELLGCKKVAVIGCGGLGGYVIEMLARLGVGHLERSSKSPKADAPARMHKGKHTN